MSKNKAVYPVSICCKRCLPACQEPGGKGQGRVRVGWGHAPEWCWMNWDHADQVPGSISCSKVTVLASFPENTRLSCTCGCMHVWYLVLKDLGLSPWGSLIIHVLVAPCGNGHIHHPCDVPLFCIVCYFFFFLSSPYNTCIVWDQIPYLPVISEMFHFFWDIKCWERHRDGRSRYGTICMANGTLFSDCYWWLEILLEVSTAQDLGSFGQQWEIAICSALVPSFYGEA